MGWGQPHELLVDRDAEFDGGVTSLSVALPLNGFSGQRFCQHQVIPGRGQWLQSDRWLAISVPHLLQLDWLDVLAGRRIMSSGSSWIGGLDNSAPSTGGTSG